jgi:hypothetical protein
MFSIVQEESVMCLGNGHSDVFMLASSICGGDAECQTLGCPSIFMNSMIDGTRNNTTETSTEQLA